MVGNEGTGRSELDGTASEAKNGGDLSGSDDGFNIVRGKRFNKKFNVARKDESGLNADRQRSFSSQDRHKIDTRVPTSNLNDMQAKEGALVSKFMTFLCRKNTFVFDLYEAAFYRSKPTFDVISEFIFKDLCINEDMKKSLVDVQLHPVKMLLFIKFNSEESRDIVNERVQSPQGVVWSHYSVRVKGYNLDAQVKKN